MSSSLLSDRAATAADVAASPTRWWRDTALALASGLASMVLAVAGLRVGIADLSQRWLMGGADQVLHYAIFSSAVDVLPVLPNDRFGFPDAMNLFFAPLFDLWSALFVAVIAPFVPSGVVALNVYIVASFAATGIAGYAFFRALRLRAVTAVVFAVVFSLLPFHVIQLTLGHPFMANYWPVPLIGILVLQAAGGRADPFREWAQRASSPRRVLARRLVPTLALVILVAFSQSYFFVFAAILVGGTWLTSAGAALLRREKPSTLVWSAVPVVGLVVLIGAQLAVLSLDLGQRYAQYFAARTPSESEYYGGKITGLILPSPTTGIGPLGDLASRYAAESSLVPWSENPGTAIVVLAGSALVLGIVLLRVVAGARPLPRIAGDERISALLIAGVIGFLFFLAGGLGTVFAYVLSPEIRSWGRMSVVLSLVALGVLALVLERTLPTWRRLLPALALVAAVALLDQVAGLPRTIDLQPSDDSALASLVSQAELSLPEGCGVVELPLKGFPETGAVGQMGDYDQALPAILSPGGDLRWSYGAVRGTVGADAWADSDTPEEFALNVRENGACAVLVDEAAYTDAPGAWRPFVAAVADPDAPLLTSSDDAPRYRLFEVGGRP